MHLALKLVIPAVLGLAGVACSQQQPASSAPVASSGSAAGPAVSAIPLTAPAPGVTADSPVTHAVQGPSLEEMLKRPAFAKAYQTMDGASTLPDWASHGSPTPSQRVEVEGKPMLLAQACKASDCAGEQMLLLVDAPDHVLQGVLVSSSGSAGASVQQLAWLGQPDATVQAFLRSQLNHD